MELFLFGVLISLVTVGLSVGGLLIARKIISVETRELNNRVADPMLQVIGTLYAVLLGLLVVQAMETFQEARQNVESEAVALADTFRLAQALPKEMRDRLQNNCLDYAAAVVNDEWDDMQEFETCDKAWEAIDKMWWEIISYEPKTVREQAVYPEVLAAAKSINDYRRSRLLTSRTRVSPILWCVLITGAASTVIFTYTFGANSLKSQLFMTSLVAITLSLNLYLWSIYSNPFYGLLRVEAEAFKMDLEHFQFYLDNPDEQRWNKYSGSKPVSRRGAAGNSSDVDADGVEEDEAADDNQTDETSIDNSPEEEKAPLANPAGASKTLTPVSE